MSWLKNSTIGASLGKLRGSSSPSKEYDSRACYDSFKEHWQQICNIIQRIEDSTNEATVKDDVLGVVNNLDQMLTLLVVELRSTNSNRPCLEYVLSENLLDKLYTWSLQTGLYESALRQEQLKLYEVLVSQSHTQLLVHEPFHRPLMRLLGSCADVYFSVEVEKSLVLLLNNLCVSLVHHSDLLYLFFDNKNINPPRFVIFSLLIRFVHREGALGQQARDALLLCMALSKHNQAVAEYITNHSNVCPVLATGLSGLYSLLPRKFDIETADWHRLTPDDVNDFPELSVFMNSLEFCNAVVQVAHPSVKNHLLELLYQGFLVPVMGPALLQSAEQELTTATAYFDLFLRSISEPGLLSSFLKFLLKEEYDGHRIINCLIQRIHSSSRLCLVTLALMETLLDFNCEDIMLELVFRHLIPCNHVMASQRSRVNRLDPYCQSPEKFLQLTPNISTKADPTEGSLYGNYQAYLSDVRNRINSCAFATRRWTYQYDGVRPPPSGFSITNNGTNGEGDNSLPSTFDASSGYESIARNLDGSSEDGGDEGKFLNGSMTSTVENESTVVTAATPSIGPFLDAVFYKLEIMLSHNFFINLRVTSVISRLAIYPQPLIRSFLLDHFLIFQPSIKSLFQILGGLKQQIESILKICPGPMVKNHTAECEASLLDREHKLVNARKYALQVTTSLPPSQSSNSEPFDRGDGKRRSLSTTLKNAVFRRQSVTSPKESSPSFLSRNKYPEDLRSIISNAILLCEWLKELAAIAQEHAVFRVTPHFPLDGI